jgi:dolichyl-phosphate beta-glucosyltransferase
MQKIAIIIPCYNEEKRIREEFLNRLLDWPWADLYLANDGSRDGTPELISSIAAKSGGRIFVLDYKKNSGKANTIFKSVNDVLAKGEYTHIGYFDADFSTPPHEILRMLDEVAKYPEKFILGSRIVLLNSKIERKPYRHYVGRIIVTIINFKFMLGVYDTQCGAKLFPVAIAGKAFDRPFLTSWLFDVEVFLRLKKAGLMERGKEMPLNEWRDVEGSKLNWKDGFKIFKELLILFRNYAKT